MTAPNVTTLALSRANLTHARLAHLLGVPRETVTRWRSGRQPPNAPAVRWLTLLATSPALALLALTHATTHTWENDP